MPTPESSAANKALRSSVVLWFCLALVGQWLFAAYIVLDFGAQTLRETPIDIFKQPNFHQQSYAASDNLLLLLHVLLAALINFAGLSQMIPQLRKRWPQLHRWNGRFFLSAGLIAAVSGLYLSWVSDARMSNTGAIGITFNGLLILLFAPLAWFYARQRNWRMHRRFAVHAFMLVSGVWFFRLALMAWFILNQGPLGNSDHLDGPADIGLSFACYLLPMALAELYFWAERKTRWAQWGAAIAIFLGNALMAVGIVAATMFMWWPRV
jgi:Predicted membrane protein (DUF2306)